MRGPCPKSKPPVPVTVLNFQKRAYSGIKFLYLFALIFFPPPQAVSFYLPLLCSAASITLCYQHASVEVVLPFFEITMGFFVKGRGK